ncbi:MAG: hypothetical protein Q27BPR15_14785 [Rhodobacter sp. CACIA14H1]|nr:MAG: hypothetical protein Q27BPR15_14785 [Rhodobacter sp. CACIA14H1]
MSDARARSLLRAFRRDEEGAVTVDWVVITAAVMLLSIPVLNTIRAATTTGATNVAIDVVAATED